MKKRQVPIRIKDHAALQYRARGGKGKLTDGMIRRSLYGVLPSGVAVRRLQIKIPIPYGLWAVMEPQKWGGWSVETVMRDRDAWDEFYEAVGVMGRQR